MNPNKQEKPPPDPLLTQEETKDTDTQAQNLEPQDENKQHDTEGMSRQGSDSDLNLEGHIKNPDENLQEPRVNTRARQNRPNYADLHAGRSTPPHGKEDTKGDKKADPKGDKKTDPKGDKKTDPKGDKKIDNQREPKGKNDENKNNETELERQNKNLLSDNQLKQAEISVLRRQTEAQDNMIGEMTQEIEEISKANRELHEELQNRIRTTATSINTITDQEIKITALEDANNILRLQVAQTSENIRKITKDNLTLKTETEQQKLQIGLLKCEITKLNQKQPKHHLEEESKLKLEEENKHLQQVNSDLKQQLAEVKQLKDNLLDKLISTPKAAPTPKQPEIEILYIADSNRTLITPKLKSEYTWTITQDIYTSQQLIEFIEAKQYTNYFTSFDNIIIMIGTNDIRLNMDTRTTFNNIKQSINILMNKLQRNVTVLQIPPQKDQTINAEVEMLNRMIEKHMHATHIITTSTTLNTQPLTTLLTEDGYHISETAAKIIAKLINELTITKTKNRHQRDNSPQPSTSQQQPPQHTPQHIKHTPTTSLPLQTHQRKEQNHTTPETHQHQYSSTHRYHTPPEIQRLIDTYTIPSNMAGHIIRKNEQGIKDLQEKYKTKITKENNEKTKTCTFTITGPPQNVKRTIDQMKSALETALHMNDNNERRKEERKRMICKFFQQGYCKFGERCDSIHPSPERRRPTQRSRSPQRRHTSKSTSQSSSDRKHRKSEKKTRRHRSPSTSPSTSSNSDSSQSPKRKRKNYKY